MSNFGQLVEFQNSDNNGNSADSLDERDALFFWTSKSVKDLNRSDLYDELSKVVLEAYEEGWDGYDALAANPVSMAHSINFIGLLPDNFLNPEVAIDIDGDVAFEWDAGPRKIISLRMSAGGSIKYASLIGFSKRYGTLYFNDSIPEEISKAISSIEENG